MSRLDPLLAWLRTGAVTTERLDFPAGGACRIADNLRMSPQASKVTDIWLQRNPIGDGDAAAAIVESAQSLRTLDLVQTGLDAPAVARLVAADVLSELYVSAAQLGDADEVKPRQL